MPAAGTAVLLPDESVATDVPPEVRTVRVPDPVQEMDSVARSTMSTNITVLLWSCWAVPHWAEPSAWASRAIASTPSAPRSGRGNRARRGGCG